MKKSLLVLFIALGLVITSCSDFQNDNSVVSPVGATLTKSTEDVSPKLVYPYLQSFKNIEVKSWIEKDAILSINLNEAVESSYSPLVGISEVYLELLTDKGSILYFLEKPENDNFAIILDSYSGIKDVKVFGFYDKEIVYGGKETAIVYPFPNKYKFSEIDVLKWDSYGTEITVETSTLIDSAEESFACLTTKDGCLLVYIGRPNSTEFSLEKYGDLGVTDIKIFSYINRFIEVGKNKVK